MSVDIGQVIDVASNVIALAAAVAAIFPNPKADGVLKVARTLVDYLAFNIGHAKNQTK